jgi:signal transduction histidine kinase/CheY-like chemotaxis protein
MARRLHATDSSGVPPVHRHPCRVAVVVAALAAAGAGRGGAQSGAAPGWRLQELAVARYDEGAGLPSGSVHAVERDRDGVLWAGTEDGAARFTGQRWRAEPFDGRARGQVRDILHASDGALWFATRTGVWRRSPDGRWRRFGVDDGLGSDITYSLVETRAIGGRPEIVVGTYAGAARFDGERFVRVPFPAGYSEIGIVVAEAPDERGRPTLFAGSPSSGVARWRDGRWVADPPSPALPRSAEAFDVPPPNRDASLLVTGDDGTAVLTSAGWWRLERGPRDAYRALAVVADDRLAEVWVGTRDGRLMRFDGARWARVFLGPDADGTPVVSLARITTDGPRPAIYAGLRGAGVVRIAPGLAARADLTPVLAVNPVWQAVPGAGGRTWWLGSDISRVIEVRDGAATMALDVRRRGMDHVRDVVRAPRAGSDGAFVLGDAGAFVTSGAGWEPVPLPVTRPSPAARAVLAPGPDGPAVHLMDTAGWFRWDGGEWRRLPVGPLPPATFGTERDRRGAMTAVWVASRDTLWRYDGRAWTPHAVDSVRSGMPFSALSGLVDGDSTVVWVGSSGGGVTRYVARGGRLERPLDASVPRGTPIGSDLVRALAADADGAWVGTSRGLTRLRVERGVIVADAALGTEDGLPSAAVRALVPWPRGDTLLVGTERGVALVGARVPPRAPRAPRLRALVMDPTRGDLPIQDGAILPEGRHTLLVALETDGDHRPAAVRFRVDLNGAPLAGGWTAEDRLTISSLPVGRHELRAVARDYLGRETEPVVLTVSVWAPWYRSRVALALYAAAAVAAGWWGARRRLRTLRDRAATAEALAREAEARRALDATLRERQKMESLGTLAGGVAHDFNNLLTVIRGNAELLREDIALDPVGRDAIDAVLRASDRARDLVRQILTFSRRDAARREPVDLAALLRGQQQLLRALLPATIELVIRVPDRAVVVLGDVTQLQQLLLNLAANAEHAMRPTNGGLLELVLEEGEAVAVLTVRDTGVGMPDDVAARAFEPFFTTKPLGEGTGLGLAVSHGVVQGHGGDVALRTSPGAGTTCVITLPLAPTDATVADAAPAATPGRLEGLRVLVVDDEPEVARVTARLLERAGAAVTVVADADAAQRAVADGSHDLVLTDQTMPGRTGDELLRDLRATAPALPVILMTGYSARLDSDEVDVRAAHAILQKPVAPDDLLRTVAAAAGRGGPT